MYRYLVMNYQLGVVGKAIDALDRNERRQLVELADRKTQGSVSESTRSAAEAFARVRSDNAQMRLHALAQWIGSAYLETRDSPHADFQTLHRRLLRTLRQLRDSLPRAGAGARAAA
ncbi:MAG TPA: hypothetical protein VFO79_14155 [Xanthomonadales bacterium]|nr:hypothetical protein [Xanthomonadales bacterium]